MAPAPAPQPQAPAPAPAPTPQQPSGQTAKGASVGYILGVTGAVVAGYATIVGVFWLITILLFGSLNYVAYEPTDGLDGITIMHPEEWEFDEDGPGAVQFTVGEDNIADCSIDTKDTYIFTELGDFNGEGVPAGPEEYQTLLEEQAQDSDIENLTFNIPSDDVIEASYETFDSPCSFFDDSNTKTWDARAAFVAFWTESGDAYVVAAVVIIGDDRETDAPSTDDLFKTLNNVRKETIKASEALD